MRKLLFILYFVFISLIAFAADKYSIYCKVTITQKMMYTYATIIIDDEPLVIVDENGRMKSFKTKMAVVNALSKLGWKLEPSSAPADKEFIMSKQVTNNAEAQKGLKKLDQAIK